MTAPTRPLRPVHRRRRFDLRTTALFFILLALLLTLAGLVARTAAAAAERRPAWAVSLLVLGFALTVACCRGRRRWSARRLVRRATEALEEAAETAVDALGETPVEVVPAGAPDPVRTSAVADVEQTLVIETADAADAADATDVTDYEALDPDEFEQAIAGLCARDGCADVEVVGGAGDLGADVIAVAPDGRRLVLQCKRYAADHKVGSQDVQRFGGTCFTVHEADVAVVVTTSDFTAPATEYATQCGILCVDGEGLRAWETGTGLRPWELSVEG
ncbi:restriction endonuclease [Streptomyces phaeoluteigriseus]|uniref:Restriction endonuclease n=1 Tax=Streptomyces phaeoluteigriseus TaxID=114686 RepID=A0A1V6MI81_9ACTN|nr:restriction endonuclease [Streptomyces phaeoluteigriseus]OQD52023.1 restriction endonuclease [Streptomyces phaeoluteigriseus]